MKDQSAMPMPGSNAALKWESNDEGDLSALSTGIKTRNGCPASLPVGHTAGQASDGGFLERLPVFGDAEADSLNVIVARIGSWCFELESQPYDFTFTWQPRPVPFDFWITARAGNTPFAFGLEWWIFDHVIALDKLEGLPKDVRPLYLEVMLEDICRILEQVTAMPVQLDSFVQASIDENALHQRLDFHITRRADGRQSAGFIRTPLEGLVLLSERARQCAPVVHPGWERIVLPLNLEIGRARLAFSLFEKLEKRDVIALSGSYRVAPGKICCRLGIAPGHYLDCVWNGQHAITIGNLMEASMPDIEDGQELFEEDDMNGIRHSEIEDNTDTLYEDDLPNRQGEPVDKIDQLPVELVFEMGVCPVSVKELKSFRMGTILRTHRSEQSPVTIKANGKKIGSGEIVRLPGQLGVRILELFNDV